jgi:hypothetical protein
MTSLPARGAAAQLASFLQQHLRWSAFWDKRYGVWRVAEDDPRLRPVRRKRRRRRGPQLHDSPFVRLQRPN